MLEGSQGSRNQSFNCVRTRILSRPKSLVFVAPRLHSSELTSKRTTNKEDQLLSRRMKDLSGQEGGMTKVGVRVVSELDEKEDSQSRQGEILDTDQITVECP